MHAERLQHTDKEENQKVYRNYFLNVEKDTLLMKIIFLIFNEEFAKILILRFALMQNLSLKTKEDKYGNKFF